jgi:hypothetical protein
MRLQKITEKGASLNKIGMIKSRKMRCEDREVRMGEPKNTCRILVAKP